MENPVSLDFQEKQELKDKKEGQRLMVEKVFEVSPANKVYPDCKGNKEAKVDR